MTFPVSARIETPPADADDLAPAWPGWHQRLPRAVRLAAALAGLAAIAGYLAVAVARLGYPFTVEWLESNSLVEVRRILHGQPLYPAPSAGYVPDGYPPLYFVVSAAVARVFGVSYLSLRLVSLLSSLACFALLARLVQRETGSIAAGTAAAGVFAATYFATGTWFDTARVDSLFLAFSAGGLYAARQMRRTRGAILAGALLAAAALTKQTGLAEGAAVLAVLAAGPRRGLAGVAALTGLGVFGIATFVLWLGSGGWYVYYVFELMSEHSLAWGSFWWFCTALLTSMGIAAAAALTNARLTKAPLANADQADTHQADTRLAFARRVPRELVAGCAALAAEGCAALVHSGGGSNDMLPAYLAVALLAGLALGDGGHAWRVTAAGLLVLAQTGLLLTRFDPAHAIPASADRTAGERLVAGMRALGGTVAVPADPGLSLLAGMAPAAHQDAVHDVLRASDQTAIMSWRRSVAAAITAHRFTAIITDAPGPPLGYPPTLTRYYRQCPLPLLAGVPAVVFRPVAGIGLRPYAVWLPRGQGSCPAAERLLDGAEQEVRS